MVGEAMQTSRPPPLRSSRAPVIDAGRALAALFGAPLLALLLGAWLSAFLPLGEQASFAVGWQLVIPLWVGLSCTVPLAESARAAWAYCLGPASVAGLMLLLRALS